MHHHNPPYDIKAIWIAPQGGEGVNSCLWAYKEIHAIFQLQFEGNFWLLHNYLGFI